MKAIKNRSFNQDALTALADLHPILQRIYAARGIEQVEQLDYSLAKLLPFNSLSNIDTATECLYEAVTNNKRILVVGDFDVDGATSTTLAISALRKFGAQHVSYLVPNRFEYGYGLTPEIVDVAAKWQPDLIITVDNGISSISGVERANKLGIDVLITDHHLPSEQLPNAVAIVNPNQVGDQFPSKNLAGVGVIYYVMLALRRYLTEKNWFTEQEIEPPNMTQFLDLVALGTVADVVPLDHNNRILVHHGMRRIRAQHCRPGILGLLDVAKREPAQLVASDLGFAIAPRLNAAGRLDDMALGIECLCAIDRDQAREKAEVLNQLNLERREIEAQMQSQALQAMKQVRIDGDIPVAICLFEEDWHQGVIGILAGRIKERFNRPVIVFAAVDEYTVKGSARSIPGIHVRDVLEAVSKQHPNLVSKFGGHAMAAGLTIEKKQLKKFSAAFYQQVAKVCRPEYLSETVLTDGSLAVEDFSLELADLIANAGPWGQEFPVPSFEGKFEIIQQRIVGRNHLKLILQPVDSVLQIDAIVFNVDIEKWPNHRCDRLQLTFQLVVNEYRGIRSPQLLVDTIQIDPLSHPGDGI